MVERNLAKVEVASSSLVSRSKFPDVEITQSVERNLAWVEVASAHLAARSKFPGVVAEWSRSGLQIRVPEFDSRRRLHKTHYLTGPRVNSRC